MYVRFSKNSEDNKSTPIILLLLVIWLYKTSIIFTRLLPSQQYLFNTLFPNPNLPGYSLTISSNKICYAISSGTSKCFADGDWTISCLGLHYPLRSKFRLFLGQLSVNWTNIIVCNQCKNAVFQHGLNRGKTFPTEKRKTIWW